MTGFNMNDGFSEEYLSHSYNLKEKMVVDGVPYTLKYKKYEGRNGKFLHVMEYADKDGCTPLLFVGYELFSLHETGNSLSEVRERLKIKCIKMEKTCKRLNIQPTTKFPKSEKNKKKNRRFD